jgi:hypothetical protein
MYRVPFAISVRMLHLNKERDGLLGHLCYSKDVVLGFVHHFSEFMITLP